MLLICNKCGKEFETEDKRVKYCSRECKESRVCVICGKSFQAANPETKTCSSECKAEHKKKVYLEKYGVDNPRKSEKVKSKIRSTLVEKYGVDNPSKSESIREKTVKTNLERYGGKAPANSKHVLEKMQETCLEKYGVDNIRKSKQVIKDIGEKRKQTCLERYGVDNVRKSQYCQQKIYETKKKNHSFNISKPEDLAKDRLLTKFPDLKCQYKSDLYPFSCDFYIPSLDLYIELNYHWTHNTGPFDPSNPDHLKEKERLESRAVKSNYYKGALKTWTKTDPLKLKTFRKNKLNYKIFYKEEEFDKWFDTL